MPHYALIDAARDENILPLIKQEARWRCLFGGPIEPELEAVAPHIVRLDPGRPITKILQSHGWINNWGVTCHAAADLMDTRRFLRRNLEAVLPTNEVVLFRFFDPRVFVPFIEACTPGDLDAWFDPVDAWWARNTKTGATMKYTRSGGQLVAETV